MNLKTNEKGFTLVELAIVMTIIGLLIGGILKGQELLENARVTSTIAQVRGYEGAIATFRDTYSALPGDMANAANRIPNCGACTAAGAGVGNGRIGGNNPVTAQIGLTAEPVLVWHQLAAANMISGVTDAAIAGGTVAWDETHPSARIGGGFHLKYSSAATTNASFTGGVAPTGHFAILQARATAVDNGVSNNVLSPFRAAQIDRKIDDGKGATGNVRGYGAASCRDGGTAGDSYNETVTTKDCSLYFSVTN